ncbi:MAG: gfo/Idh/MocA family oxidoreductase [Caldilineae bacterium]|nr:MAG: gfo/Idh/MocA family oxidoreductase [Caldilineae bacterium]
MSLLQVAPNLKHTRAARHCTSSVGMWRGGWLTGTQPFRAFGQSPAYAGLITVGAGRPLAQPVEVEFTPRNARSANSQPEPPSELLQCPRLSVPSRGRGQDGATTNHTSRRPREETDSQRRAAADGMTPAPRPWPQLCRRCFLPAFRGVKAAPCSFDCTCYLPAPPQLTNRAKRGKIQKPCCHTGIWGVVLAKCSCARSATHRRRVVAVQAHRVARATAAGCLSHLSRKYVPDLLRTAVIGVGSMGSNHARVYARMPSTTLVAIADSDPEQRDRVARTYRARAYADYREMLEQEELDIVTIALPTHLHCEAALETLARGIHTFVEKPLADSVANARRMIDASERHGVLLGVGHIERFNPAVIALKERLRSGQLGKVYQIHSRRVGPFPPRVTDVGVVFDLATHELNVMEYLVGTGIYSISAEVKRTLHDDHEDLVVGILRFPDDIVGVLDINWLTPTKIRHLSILGERGMFQVNYLTQELWFYENRSATDRWEGLAKVGVSEGAVIKYELERVEPLRAELEVFVDAVLNGYNGLVNGEEGLRAVYLAEQLLRASREGNVVILPPYTPIPALHEQTGRVRDNSLQAQPAPR